MTDRPTSPEVAGEPAGSGGRTEPAGSGGSPEPAGSGGRTEPAGSGGRTEPDPGVTSALRSLEAPPHRYGFWADLDARFVAELGDPPTTMVPRSAAADPPTSGVPPFAAAAPPPPTTPLAEVVALPSPPSRPTRWWPAAAAALVVVALGVAALVGTTITDVRSTTAATSIPVLPSTVPSTTPAPATTVSPITVPPTTAQVVPTSAAPRPSTTARPASSTLSPDGLGPLRLGMTHGEAMASGAVGRFEDPLDTGGQCGYADAAGPYKGDFGSLYLNGRLARIYAGSRLRTPQGIGKGSPASRLSTIPGTRVESPHPYDDPANPIRTNVDITNGDAGYQFTIEGDKVIEWSVGTVEGLSLIEACA